MSLFNSEFQPIRFTYLLALEQVRAKEEGQERGLQFP